MNEEKIKELKAQIKVLEKEKPRSNREILESIEKLLKELIQSKQSKSITEVIEEMQRCPSIQPIVHFPRIPSSIYPFAPKEDYHRIICNRNDTSPHITYNAFRPSLDYSRRELEDVFDL